MDLLDKCRHLFCDGISVLDVGCGDGKLTSEILKLNNNIKSIIGIDGSSSQINFSSENNVSDKISFSVGK